MPPNTDDPATVWRPARNCVLASSNGIPTGRETLVVSVASGPVPLNRESRWNSSSCRTSLTRGNVCCTLSDPSARRWVSAVMGTAMRIPVPGTNRIQALGGPGPHRSPARCRAAGPWPCEAGYWRCRENEMDSFFGKSEAILYLPVHAAANMRIRRVQKTDAVAIDCTEKSSCQRRLSEKWVSPHCLGPGRT